MASYDYHFVTHWKVQGSPQRVYEILKAGHHYAQWWRPAYLESRLVGPQKVTSMVRARLPYTLKFTTELIREAPFKELEIRASGELAGTGLWRLSPQGDKVRITFDWDVRAEKPWVRRLSCLLKPLFCWNHNWVMKTGERALQAYLVFDDTDKN